MINVFYKNRNRIGHLMVALMFVGAFGILISYDGFILTSQAASSICCGGQQTTSFAADSSGTYGSDIPMDAESTGNCCGGENAALIYSSYSEDCDDSSGCNDCDTVDCRCVEDSSSCCGPRTCAPGDGGCNTGCYDDDDDNVCNCANTCGSDVSECTNLKPCAK